MSKGNILQNLMANIPSEVFQQLDAEITEEIINEITGEIDQYLPIIEGILAKYGPVFAEKIEAIHDFSVKLDVKAFEEFQNAGMKSYDAVSLLIARKQVFKKCP